MVAVLLALVILGAVQRPTTAYNNDFNKDLNFECGQSGTYAGGVHQFSSYHSNDKEDRRFKIACSPWFGNDNNNGDKKWYTKRNNYDGVLDFRCPKNQYISGIKSTYSHHHKDREWSFQCKEIIGATLGDHAISHQLNNYDDEMRVFSPDRGKTLCGFKSKHDGYYEDRIWWAYQCNINCDHTEGYYRTTGQYEWKCKRAYCPSFPLPDNAVSVSCSSSVGTTCSVSCKDGFHKIAGDDSRKCHLPAGTSAAYWDGTPTKCEDIDECQDEDLHGCISPAKCVNDPGTFHCECPYEGVGLDSTNKACDLKGIRAQVHSTSDGFEVRILNGASLDYPEYSLSIAEWSFDLANVVPLQGYPKTLPTLQTIKLSDLRPGRRFQVKIIPLLIDNGEKKEAEPELQFIAGSVDGDISTDCGCNTETTGRPSELLLTQEKGHVYFEWTDESMCETSFTFTRDGLSLDASYDVTSSDACGDKHKPLTISDNLALQKEDIYAALGSDVTYTLPKADFSIRVHRATSIGGLRFAYPAEIAAGYGSTQQHAVEDDTTTQHVTTTTSTASAEIVDNVHADTDIAATSAPPLEVVGTFADGAEAFEATTTQPTTTREDTTADIFVGPTKKERDVAYVEATVASERVYEFGTTTEIPAPDACQSLCLQQDWCLGYVVQHTGDSDILCHQLRQLMLSTLLSSEKSAVSYEVIRQTEGSDLDAGDATSGGGFLFEGSISSCEQRCSEELTCQAAVAGDGFCAWLTDIAPAASGYLSSLHPKLTQRDAREKLQGALPGSSNMYCVRATNPTWYDAEGYNSAQKCEPLTIEWESTLSGQVIMDSDEVFLPVKGVTVHATIGDDWEQTVETKGNGKFEIHVKSPDLRDVRQEVKLTFFKQSGDIFHTFKCGGVACLEQTVVLEHLSFDETIEVRDTTTVGFSGRVTIGGTEHNGYTNGCPLKDVTVCLSDRLNGNARLGCVSTDAQGNYLASAVIGSSVTVELYHGNSSHIFERAEYLEDGPRAPSGFAANTAATSVSAQRQPYYDIDGEKIWEGIDFKDVTTVDAIVDVAGGKCNLELGLTVLEFRYDSCPTWVRTEQTSTRLSEWTLPAQLISVRFVRVERKGQVRGEITRYFSAVLGSARIKHLDLRVPHMETNRDKSHVTVRFEYHVKPTLEVTFDKNLASETCTQYADGSPLTVLASKENVAVEVLVREDYSDAGVCDDVEGSVRIWNQVGESEAFAKALYGEDDEEKDDVALLSACFDNPCEVEIKRDVDTSSDSEEISYSNSHVIHNFKAGEPQVNSESLSHDKPHTKLFQVSIHIAPYDRVSYDFAVVVTGHRSRGAGSSVALPSYKPLLVVQDPPGGLSTASYESVHASFKLVSKEFEFYDGFEIGAEVSPITVEQESELCTGPPGAQACIKFGQTESKPFTVHTNTLNLFGGKPYTDNGVHEQIWSFTIDVETSDVEMVAGEYSDMFLVPSINVVYVETDVVTFEAEKCKAVHNLTTTFTINRESSENTMTWLSAFEVEFVELPRLKALRQEKRNDENLTDEERDVLLARINHAISSWKETLEYNRKLRNPELQKENDLEAVQEMWGPKQLKAQGQGNPFDFRFSDAMKDKIDQGLALAPHDAIESAEKLPPPDGAATEDDTSNVQTDLESVNMIKFSGGGSTYTFSYESEDTQSVEDAELREHEFAGGASSENVAKFFGLGPEIVLIGLGHHQESHANTEENGFTNSFSASFTLGDPDPYDVFDVKIYKHPDFNTLIFHTIGGQSSCPNEAGTLDLENFENGVSIVVTRGDGQQVMPGQMAVFEISITYNGLASSFTDLNLYMLDGENQVGMKVFVDGHPLSVPIDLEGFPVGQRRSIITVEAGPGAYGDLPVSVGVRSLCEAERHADNGFLTDETTSYKMVTLNAHFVQPCSSVKLVGELGETGRFVVNGVSSADSVREGQMRIVAFNPETSARSWLDDSRLEKVLVEYKPIKSHVWLSARDADGEELNIIDRENEYGYVTAWWDVSQLAEGFYELRLHTKCEASFNEMPPGVDDNYSNTVTGPVDRQGPVVIGYPFPADGIYTPGDDLGFEFNEELQCVQPFWFQVSLKVDGLEREFGNDNMVIVCEGRRIIASLRRGFSWEDVSGKSAQFILEGVEDINGNLATQTLVNSFRFADIEASGLAVEVTGIPLSMPYLQAYFDKNSAEFADLENTIRSDIAESSGVDESRVELASASPQSVFDFSAGTVVSVYILPESGLSEGSRRRSMRGLSPSAGAEALLTSLQSRNATASDVFASLINSTAVAGVEFVPSKSVPVFDNSTVTQPPAVGASGNVVKASSENTDLLYAILALHIITLCCIAFFLVKKFCQSTASVKYQESSQPPESSHFRNSIIPLAMSFSEAEKDASVSVSNV